MYIRFFFAFLFLIAFSALPGQGIEFFKGTWEEALVKAEQEDKPIFVDAYASWCGPCKRMAAQVFPKPEVGKVFNANFISLKIDMEKPEAAGFRAENPVRAYPTLMFFDARGKRIHTKVGGQQASGLIAQAREALGKVDDLAAYHDKYQAGERQPAFMLKYVRALVRQGEPHLKVANDHVRSQKDQLTEADNLRLLLVAATEADSHIFDKLVEHRSAVIDLLSREAFDQQVGRAFAATRAKAVELNAPDLLTKAAKKYKQFDGPAAGLYELEGEWQIAAEHATAKDALKAAKKYHKKIADGDADRLHSFYKLLTEGRHGQDQKVRDLAVIVGNEAAAAKNDFRSYYEYASWLHAIDRPAEALEAAQKAKSLVPENQANTLRMADYLLKKIQGA